MALTQRYAIITFTTTLSFWKYHENKLQDQGKDLEEDIKPLYPMLNDQDWDEFIKYRETEQYKKANLDGKKLRKALQGNHRLGTRGYEGKKPKWVAEDTEFASQDKAMPLDDILEPTTRNYFWSLATYEENVRVYNFTYLELAKAAKRGVIYLLNQLPSYNSNRVGSFLNGTGSFCRH